MRILVLGGTKFLGRAFVAAALVRGHEVTLFNRGRTDPGAFPGIEHLRGDRRHGEEGLAPLSGRGWDAVFDPSTHLPPDLEASARLLAPRVPRYLYVSSISAYADLAAPGLREDAPLADFTAGHAAEVRALPAGQALPMDRLYAIYGPLKAECERTLARVAGATGTGALVVRPGLIVGPHDASDRFPYWPRRLMRGGEVLAPGDPDRPVQFVDVRDLAEWCVAALERALAGTFHVSGPAPGDGRPGGTGLTMGEVLAACGRVAARRGAPPARITWVDDDFLDAQKVGPWMEMPLWIPARASAMAGMMRIDLSRALAAGLAFRPLEETIADTLAWDEARPAGTAYAAGMEAGREAAVMAAWHGSAT